MMHLLPLAAAMLAAVLTFGAGGVPAQTPHTHEHRFSEAERWARHFEDPARDVWQKPHQVIQSLDLPPDAAVADIGAGTGYFSVRLARMLPKGRVYAVDVEPDMVLYVGKRAEREGLANLQSVLAKADDPQLPVRVDRVLMVDVFHHLRDPARYFRRLREYLKPGAQVAVVDFTRESPIGPPPAERLTAAQVRGAVERAGYRLVADHDFLPNQYFLVFE